jgi:hypothetical protein
MYYESIDPNCKGEKINLAHCCDCNYSGNKGYWIGTQTIGGKQSPIEGVVELDNDDTWHVDDIIDDDDEFDGFDGEAYCPICKSPNLY